MPVRPTYPGVYVEEIPSGVRTITGVSTSLTAFVGYFRRGEMDEPVHLFSFSDFERAFGGLDRKSEASYAIQQFFTNGGTEALVIRTAKEAEKAGVWIQDEVGGTDVLKVEAANEGAWGNNLRITIDYETRNPDEEFNLQVEEHEQPDEPPVQTETFRNLSMDPTSSRYAKRVINEEATLIRVTEIEDNGNRPLDKLGTVGSKDLIDELSSGDEFSDPVRTDQISLDTIYIIDVEVEVEGSTEETHQITVETPTEAPSLQDVINMLRNALREEDDLEAATVEVTDDNKLHVRAPNAKPSTILRFSDDSEDLASKLGLTSPEMANVQWYPLGIPEGDRYGAANGVQKGADGEMPDADELKGSRDDKTGLYALEDADIFNILCIPRTAELEDEQAVPVIGEALDYCADQRAFMIVDVPNKAAFRGTDSIREIKSWVDANSSTLRHDHAALYFPRLRVPDPLDEYRPRSVGASGTLAGVCARTDTERGVWKAPAGTEAVLRGVHSLEYTMSNAENGTLNPLGINCLRTFPVYGTVSWGGRTLRGADRLADEYKYIPVRRLALFLEESLYRGLQWVVFEPNDEPLWAQIRMNVGDFMQNLFRQGAFQGTSPSEAYFVKCDSETTTQTDINNGIVNIVVGFAPLKPAEFVILKIQQMAGQEQ